MSISLHWESVLLLTDMRLYSLLLHCSSAQLDSENQWCTRGHRGERGLGMPSERETKALIPLAEGWGAACAPGRHRWGWWLHFMMFKWTSAANETLEFLLIFYGISAPPATVQMTKSVMCCCQGHKEVPEDWWCAGGGDTHPVPLRCLPSFLLEEHRSVPESPTFKPQTKTSHQSIGLMAAGMFFPSLIVKEYGISDLIKPWQRLHKY